MHTHTLIIGGGFAGVVIAQNLEKQGIRTLLVDRKDHFEVTYAVLRDVVDPAKTSGQARKYYREILSGRFIQSGVAELTPTSAILENNDVVEFDNVVIASGSRYPTLPLAKSVSATSMIARKRELSQYQSRLSAASSVLILGGGVVGVELAGEVSYAFPNTEVTLAHKSANLLEGFSPKAQQKALQQLLALGVNVEFNTFYEEQNGDYVDRESGQRRQADLILTATGTRPNNQFLSDHFSEALNPEGFVRVDSHLKVMGYKNVYAVGDVAEVGEAKLGYLAVEQGKYIARAIYRESLGKSVKPYKRHPFMALVPTGQKTGVVQLPFAVSTWKHLVNLKQKDLFISKTYKEFSI